MIRPVVTAAWYLLLSCRPWQWVKNLFVLAPLFFSANFLDLRISLVSTAGFVVFCLLSSAVYLLNDLADIERDRHHPIKQRRPIAAGKLSPGVAWAAMVGLIAVSSSAAWVLDRAFFGVSLGYLALNIAYSYGLKRLVVVDAVTVAMGFVLRVWAGSILAEVVPTAWILMSTFFLALFMAFGKRRGELLEKDVVEAGQRVSLLYYEVRFLDSSIAIAACSSVMSYSLFSVSEYAIEKFRTEATFFTVPFVALGVLRYLHLVYSRNRGRDPTMALLRDVPLILTVGAWFVTIVTMIALARL